MGSPFLIIVLGAAYAALLGVSLWLRPPLTARGRFFYGVTGVLGLALGALLLSWNATESGYGQVHPTSMPDKPLSEVVGQMFAFTAEGHGLSTLLACSACGLGMW